LRAEPGLLGDACVEFQAGALRRRHRAWSAGASRLRRLDAPRPRRRRRPAGASHRRGDSPSHARRPPVLRRRGSLAAGAE
jgi:hypothetical protein